MDKASVDGATQSRRISLAPSQGELVDAAAMVVLGVIALLEFQSTFGGVGYLIAGGTGLVLGVLLTHVANALKQPAVVLMAMFVGAFFLLGGAVALRGGSSLPTGSTLRSLATVSVFGWKDLLTTLPRVDGVGTLLALPYLLGLLAGLVGYGFASRTRLAFLPVAAPFLVFLAVILLGSVDPRHTVGLACAFGVGALLWGTVRSNRVRPVADSGSGRRARLATGGVLLLVTGLGAGLLGGSVPGHAAHDRVVLRKYVNPPSNIDDYASPLAMYREYAGHQKVNGKVVSLADEQLMSVHGSLPAGTPIKFVTLDRYNGVVWAASTDHQAAFGPRPNSFIRVGKTLDNPAPGRRYTMTVSVDKYDDYWMPVAGAVQSLSFTDEDAGRQFDEFRYNLATGTGVDSGKIKTGTTYELTVADVTPKMLKAADQLSTDGYSDAGAFLKETATTLAGGKGGTTDEVLQMAASLKSLGRYTHGDPGSAFQYYLPGHSMGRLSDFVRGVFPGVLYVGDDEQYAAAFALMVQQLGVPARVVVGVEALPQSGTIQGKDVHAWVEVRATDGAWRMIPTSAFVSSDPPDLKQLKQLKSQQGGSVVPPPAQGRPKTTDNLAAQSNSDSASQRKQRLGVGGWRLPSWLVAILRYVGPPLLLVLTVVGGIVGAKTLRRRRRMSRGSPSIRLAHGWRELTDHARDLGTTVPARTTRREQAQHIGGSDVGDLARLADQHVFGAGDIDDADAHHFWQQVHATRKAMRATVGRRRRALAAISVTTFFPSRRAAAR